MSKTIDALIEKSKILIEGNEKNLNVLRDKGIDENAINSMKENLEKLAKASEECDAAYEVLSAKRSTMNAIMTQVKDEFYDKKKIIKNNFPQEQWIRFGVQDKR